MKITYRSLLFLQSLAALLALGAALVAQYVFHLHPCELCLLQRYPYAVVAGAGLFAAWRLKKPKMQLFFVLILALLFALDASIAFYHTGVEMNIFKGPDACSNASPGGEKTLEELRAEIMNAPLVSCKQAMATIFGLSMAAWNGLFASACVLMSIIGCLYAKKYSR